MSRYWKQLNHESGEARRKLHERLQREDMGDEAYEKMKSHAGDRAFRIFGLVFILLFGAAVLAVTGMGW